MSYGLQVRDGANNIILTITDRLTRFITQFTVSVGAKSSVTIGVSGITPDGTWFAYYFDPFAGVTINNGSVTVYNGEPRSSITVTVFIFRC